MCLQHSFTDALVTVKVPLFLEHDTYFSFLFPFLSVGLLFSLCFRMDPPQRNKLRVKKCVSSQDDMKETSEVILSFCSGQDFVHCFTHCSLPANSNLHDVFEVCMYLLFF